MALKENRAEARFPVEVAAEIYTSNAVIPANTRNLSNSGVCLDMSEALEEGIAVGISLFFTSDGIEDPDAEPLNVKGTIVWCSERDDDGFSAGAQFGELSPEHTSRLTEFLSALGD